MAERDKFFGNDIKGSFIQNFFGGRGFFIKFFYLYLGFSYRHSFILAEFYFNNRYMRIFSFMPFNRGFAIFASFLSYFCFDLEYKKFGFKKINGDYINMARVKTVVMFCPDIGVKKKFVDKLRKGRCDDSFGA